MEVKNNNKKKWDIIYVICKVFLFVEIAIVAIPIVILLYFGAWEVVSWIRPELDGSYNLGKGVYMLEWDGGGRIIVQCHSLNHKTCTGGSRLIPKLEDGYEGKGDYVIDAEFDENWIITRTDNRLNHERKFYIIDKSFDKDTTDADEIINNYIYSFTDSIAFANECEKRGIKLKWKKK